MAKVIFINRFFYPDLSATSQMLSNLAFSLAGNGWSVHVITSRQRYEDACAALSARENIRGVQVHRVRTSRFSRAGLAGRALDYLSFYLNALWRLARGAAPGDVIVAKTDPPLLSVVVAGVASARRARLVNWLQELALELHNAGADERRYAEHGRDLCQAVLAQPPDKEGFFRINFRADLVELLYMLGEDEAGERIMLELIRNHPQCAAGYARLAEILGYGPTRERGPIDVPRAVELLERALARPVEDAEDYDLALRLRDLRARAQQQDQGATSPPDRDTERASRAAKSWDWARPDQIQEPILGLGLWGRLRSSTGALDFTCVKYRIMILCACENG